MARDVKADEIRVLALDLDITCREVAVLFGYGVELLAQLVKFELTLDQVVRIADPTARAEAAIAATEKELVANPYLICETDQGTDSIAFSEEPPDQKRSDGSGSARNQRQTCLAHTLVLVEPENTVLRPLC